MSELTAEAWIEVGPDCPITYETDEGTDRVHFTFGGGINGGVDLLVAPAALTRFVGLAQEALARSEPAGGAA